MLFAGSYNPFGKGWTFLLCPWSTPTVPKLQTPTSSCASQCLAVAPCLADHGKFSLLSELLLLLALSLFMRVLPGCFFRLSKRRLFTFTMAAVWLDRPKKCEVEQKKQEHSQILKQNDVFRQSSV